MAGMTTAAEAVVVPSERDQFAALLEVRWRIFVRNMRNSDAKISFVLYVLGRIIIFAFGLGVGIGCGAAAYFGYTRQPSLLTTLFTFVLMGWQGFSLVRGTVPNGVEVELHRFPMRLRTYIVLWLSAGVLEGLTIIGAVGCLGLFIGLAAAGAGVLLSAFVILLFFAINLLLSRVLYLWLGRLLAKRRTREVVLITCSLVGLLPRLLQTMSKDVLRVLHRLPIPPQVYLVLHWAPPYLAAHTLMRGSDAPLRALGLLVWAVVPATALTLGLRRAFRGENVQEFSASSVPKHMTARRLKEETGSEIQRPALLIAQMEWARLRHSGVAMYQMIAPLLLVAMFGLRMASGRQGSWILPMAAAYIGLTLRCGNAFGRDGAGAQLWLLFPMPLRTVLEGKNLFATIIYVAQLIAATLLVHAMTRRLQWAPILFTACWGTCFVAISFVVSNLRSLQSPKRVVEGAASMRSRGQGGGGWQLLVVIIGTVLLGGTIVAGALYLHRPMLAPACMLPFAVAAVLFYRHSLQNPMFNGDIFATEKLTEVSRSAA
jgi:ABC-2 type transport system permease protein